MRKAWMNTNSSRRNGTYTKSVMTGATVTRAAEVLFKKAPTMPAARKAKILSQICKR